MYALSCVGTWKDAREAYGTCNSMRSSVEDDFTWPNWLAQYIVQCLLEIGKEWNNTFERLKDEEHQGVTNG